MTDRYQKIREALAIGPTPGPWKVGDQNGHCGISIDSDESIVATAYLRLITSRAKWGEEHFALPENQEAVANATLIAACDPDTILALLAERDALARDAARYRWLRKGANDDIAVVRGLGAMDYGMSAVVYTYSEEIDGDDLDAAIDAAMLKAREVHND